ncbi:uncharacterized protein LOC118647058 [Monomorium pharaonis]|uniref:uncharacterized protein LOC118647058 n=1 Tax=Monomorium pharaonis TaxID=307658 RepID=UPI0017477596|nr:uncharacterized protein LOC118647058 [Monomorium pharaonis]
MLQQTYPLQRIEFNHRKGTIYSCLETWPLLMEPKYLIQHASILLGKKVNTIWNQNVGKIYKKLHVFIEEFTIKHKLKKSTNRKTQLRVLKNVLTESATAANDLASETPLILAIFPLILHYFQENPDMMFRVINDTLTEEKLESFADTSTPLLIIEGASLFDENTSCAVIVEGKICCKTKSILQGFELTFLMYYIFSLCYCRSTSKSLEFIQRIFFSVNPTGTTKSKSKRSTYDPAVKKLYDSINITS